MLFAFYINELSLLRYFIPLVDAFHRLRPQEEIICFFSTESTKYHALGLRANLETFKKIIATRPFVRLKEHKGKESCDVLFTVETVGADKVAYKKHFAIQHGVDYWLLAKRADKNTVYLMSSSIYNDDFRVRHPMLKSVACSSPISFWNAEDYLVHAQKHLHDLGWSGGKVATLFYPESGYQDEMRDLIGWLERKGYFVVVKQRKKHQEVPSHVKHCVYDHFWYPPESIYFPVASDVTLGFGTSAFVDLAVAGVNYVDVAFSLPYFDTATYLRPQVPNFRYVTENKIEKIFTAVESIPDRNFDAASIRAKGDAFLGELLHDPLVFGGTAS